MDFLACWWQHAPTRSSATRVTAHSADTSPRKRKPSLRKRANLFIGCQGIRRPRICSSLIEKKIPLHHCLISGLIRQWFMSLLESRTIVSIWSILPIFQKRWKKSLSLAKMTCSTVRLCTQTLVIFLEKFRIMSTNSSNQRRVQLSSTPLKTCRGS